MLRFTVDHPIPDPVTNAFIALVNRLLPNGWRFTISPRPHMAYSTDPFAAVFPQLDVSVAMPGFGRLEQWDRFRTLEQQGDAWRRRFQTALTSLIGSGQTSSFELIRHDPIQSDQVFIDSYFTGVIDVGDLEQMPPVDAAAALVHTLQESQSREAIPTIPGFEQRHQQALAGMEAQVMGGTRLEAAILTRPRGVNLRDPPPGLTFEMWVPFQLPGGAIRAVVRTVRRRTILHSRLAGFASLEDFRRLVPL
jgi:hypothetical protein